MRIAHSIGFVLGILMPLTASHAASPKTMTELRVFPADVNLQTSGDYQSLVVQAAFEDGTTLDVTVQAQWKLADESLVKREGATLHPVKDGQTQLTISHNGQSVQVPVKVEKATEVRPISFNIDVMPVFMKAECNNGSCHGAARGKDGFRLSLFGFDPEGDHYRLTREQLGRRVNLAIPEDSLILTKNTGDASHTGGKKFEKGDYLYSPILRWLQAGTPLDPPTVAKVVGLEIYPNQAVLEGEGATQQITVRDKYSDGTDRDVTNLAAFFGSNDSSATISKEGLISAGQRGEAYILARFDTITVASQILVIPQGLENFKFPEVAEHNYIDTLVNNKLKKLRIVPSEICSDEEFLRRVYIDIVGRLPTIEEYNRFMEHNSGNKRVELVDELLDRKEFAELWVMKWAELLQIKSSNQVSYKAMLLYYNWLQDRIASNTPMNVIVRDLLAATGGSFASPATNYYAENRQPIEVAENVAQVFMGMRIQCAQCHNHPFDRWTTDDYYGFAAFFAQIGKKQAEDAREAIIFNRGGGDVRHIVGNRVMEPKFLGGGAPDVKGKDRRAVLAQWLASPDNPFFAKNLSNIVWAHFFGRGIVEAVDDVRISNPPSNPELLDELASKFTSYDYDFRRLVRDICTSRTYQLSTRVNDTNKLDDRNFSHQSIRRVRAEVLLDAITQVTDTKNKFPGLPLGARAVEIADGRTNTYFLTTFGRATRETVCSCEVKMEPNLSQALHLLNGDTVNSKIAQGGVVKKMLDAKKAPAEIIEDLYIRSVARKPTQEETNRLVALVEGSSNKQQTLEDVFWALLNSKEFLFNH